MTFEEWFDTTASPELKEIAKELESLIVKLVRVAWQTGYNIGYEESIKDANI